jgi:hypothetical protein
MDSPQKQVFLIHSKSDERESALAEAVVPRLVDVGIHVWLYEDWAWEHKVRRPNRGAPRSSGRPEELDYQRYLQGHPQPFRAPVDEIDEAELADMLHTSSVVLLCEPREGQPSEGVVQERKVLASITRAPILMHVLWPDSAGGFFAPLRPNFEIRLPESDASAIVADEVFAATAAGWLVHRVQRRYGLAGGHRLLARARLCDAALKPLIEGSPLYEEAEDGDAGRSPGDPEISAMLAGFFELDETEFKAWWTEGLAPLRARADGLIIGSYSRMLLALLSTR